MLDMEFMDEDPMHRVIHDKDGKLLSNVISPVVKKGFEHPIDSQNIFHQTQFEHDEQMNKVKIDTYLNSLLESNKKDTSETVESLYTFMNAQFKRYHIQLDKFKKQNDKQKQKIDQLNNHIHQSASQKHVEDILRDCLDEVKREREMNQMKTLQAYQGTNTARRAEENAADRVSLVRKSDAFINPSDHTLATFRGAEKEYLDDEGTIKMTDEWKGHEKRKIIEKFLSKDEIFFKIL